MFLYIQLWSFVGCVSQCLRAQFSGGHLALFRVPTGSKCSVARPTDAPAARADTDFLIVLSCR